jgi:hypothetical protein
MRLLILGILGVMASATPALASVAIRVPEPTTLVLVIVGGGVAGAVTLGRKLRNRRDARRRRDDH